MRNAGWFLRAVGVFYLLNLVGTLPWNTRALFELMYPGLPLDDAVPHFTLLQDAWLVIGAQLAAIGVVALWGSRDPLRHMAVVKVVIATEVGTGLWDLYSVLVGRMGLAFWLVLLIVHAAWIFWAVHVVRAADPGPRPADAGRRS